MSFLDDAIRTIGQGLAQTAINEVDDQTGLNVGGALQSLFGNGQAFGGDTLAQTAAALAGGAWPSDEPGGSLLTNMVQQQTQLIMELGNQLNAISGAISQIQGEIANIEQMLNKINLENLYTEWSVADTPVSDNTVPTIRTAYTTYGAFIAQAGKTGPSPETVGQFLTGVANPSTGFANMIASINSAILDGGEKKGLLQLWSNMVVPLVLNESLDYREAVAQYLAYYSKLTYAQLQAVNLVMEAANFSADGPSGDSTAAKAAWTQYRKFLLSQEQPFIRWLIPLVMAGASQGSNAASFSNIHAQMQLDPGVQALGGVGSGSYYEPSPVFRSAEQLLATLYVTEPDDRRIVVHLIWSDQVLIDAQLAPLELSLVVPQTTSIFGASSLVTLGQFPWNTQQLSDFNLAPIGTGLYLKRLIYSAGGDETQPLPDGTYSIHDPGLPLVSTYETATTHQPDAPAFTPAELAYTVYVDGTQQFDFMNVLAYTTPFAIQG